MNLPIPLDFQTIAGILTLLLLIFGGYAKSLRSKLKKIEKLLRTIEEALEDEKITKEELKKIYEKAKEIIS